MDRLLTEVIVKIVKRILLAFGAILVVLLAVGFLLPRQVHVERSATIDAPPGVVFANVDDLRRWEAWTPWGKDRDPTVAMTYSEPTAGKGAWFAWTSEDLGSGKLEIVDSRAPESIDMRLSFADDPGEPAKCGFTFAADSGGKTNVTWHFDADMGAWPPGRYFGLFMDKLLGGDYEQGLANLKRIAEAQAKTQP